MIFWHHLIPCRDTWQLYNSSYYQLIFHCSFSLLCWWRGKKSRNAFFSLPLIVWLLMFLQMQGKPNLQISKVSWSSSSLVLLQISRKVTLPYLTMFLSGNISATTFEMHDDILVNTLGLEEVSRPKYATHTEDATTDNERCIPAQSSFCECFMLLWWNVIYSVAILFK